MPFTAIYGWPGRGKSLLMLQHRLRRAEKYQLKWVTNFLIDQLNLAYYCQINKLKWLEKTSPKELFITDRRLRMLLNFCRFNPLLSWLMKWAHTLHIVTCEPCLLKPLMLLLIITNADNILLRLPNLLLRYIRLFIRFVLRFFMLREFQCGMINYVTLDYFLKMSIVLGFRSFRFGFVTLKYEKVPLRFGCWLISTGKVLFLLLMPRLLGFTIVWHFKNRWQNLRKKGCGRSTFYKIFGLFDWDICSRFISSGVEFWGRRGKIR